ncbi:MAG: hypothetical protein L6R37_004504 [Teloschistes peruensis]|nr:MAG: hypothetical protein L6R37_004504 [Teloschistes peruensis]
MVFEVVAAEPSDIPAIASMHIAAFKEDPIMGHLMPKATYQDQYDYFANFYRKSFAEKQLTGSVFRKVVETETGKLVGFSKWKYAYSLTPEQQAEKKKLDTKRTYPEGTNVALYEQFFGELDNLRKKNCDEYKDYCKPPSRHRFAMAPANCYTVLHLLIIDPAYQRKGLGTMLIRESLAAADRDNARAYVEASPKGLGLYKKYGWKECDEIVVDMRHHGGTRVCSEMCLMREPGASTTS